ncbi:MAG: DinB family protein [Thermomicrobiaceae bacterium]|nr:DinB family protein [Thermomicrobiaceae bacterium]
MEPLREMFRYHVWATRTLIDHCAELPVELLDQTAPAAYGTVIDTLVHLLSADQRYLEVLTGEQVEPRIREGMRPPLADLRARLDAQAERWEAVLDRVAAGDLDVTLPGRGSWPETPHATNLLLGQAIHHGDDHRTQITAILATAGRPAPDIDVWAYWLATHL